jgi:hypothetical protein
MGHPCRSALTGQRRTACAGTIPVSAGEIPPEIKALPLPGVPTAYGPAGLSRRVGEKADRSLLPMTRDIARLPLRPFFGAGMRLWQ